MNSIFRGRRRSLFDISNYGFYKAFRSNPYGYVDIKGLVEVNDDSLPFSGSIQDDKKLLEALLKEDDPKKRIQMIWDDLKNRLPTFMHDYLVINKFEEDKRGQGSRLSVKTSDGDPVESAKKGIVEFRSTILPEPGDSEKTALARLATTRSGLIHESMLIWFAKQYNAIEYSHLNSSLHNALILLELMSVEYSGIARLNEEDRDEVLKDRITTSTSREIEKILMKIKKELDIIFNEQDECGRIFSKSFTTTISFGIFKSGKVKITIEVQVVGRTIFLRSINFQEV